MASAVSIPQYGWSADFSYQPPEQAHFFKPKVKHILEAIPFTARYIWEYLKLRRQGKTMFIDHPNHLHWNPIYGVPLGGIGGCAIGRGFKGEFCRFNMIPGMYKHYVVPANQFIVTIRKEGETIYQQVLSPMDQPKSGAHLSAWNWGFPIDKGSYHGLYPRSWTSYDLSDINVVLICRQVSPVIPHDYKESCLPGGVFIWNIKNNNDYALDVSITFTFKNGQGGKHDKNGGCHCQPFEAKGDDMAVNGVEIHQHIRDIKTVYGVAAKSCSNVSVTHQVSFDPRGTGAEIWDSLKNTGKLGISKDASHTTTRGHEIAAAVCAFSTVASNSSSNLEFSLTVDQPIIHFGSHRFNYQKRYCRWFGHKGDATPALALHFLTNYADWESRIESWQTPILQNEKLPDWYKSALFNELYFISDGGEVWVDLLEEDHPLTANHPKEGETPFELPMPPLVKEYGRFAYLEGHEYRMYNTYDVHYYASWALLQLWPKLELSIQYDFLNSIPVADTTPRRFIMRKFSNHRGVVKFENCVPHDIGDPDFEPWVALNGYWIHCTSKWKDLNTKFVLAVYRDWVYTKDDQFLNDSYANCVAVLKDSLKFDTDGDGLIDNSGMPDQTYDAWVMTGASAYCGGLWLAALKAVIELAKARGEQEDVDFFTPILDKGKVSYETKLWNGRYYEYDTSHHRCHDSVMADQLCGHWFLKASGLADDEVFPRDHVRLALNTIFEMCVMPFRKGTMGAINGVRACGKFDTTSIQSEEFWTGVGYSLAALMIQEDMVEQGMQVAEGVYRHMYERLGLAFQTPEGYTFDNQFRSLGYMRPLAIWGVQFALEKYHPEMMNGEK